MSLLMQVRHYHNVASRRNAFDRRAVLERRPVHRVDKADRPVPDLVSRAFALPTGNLRSSGTGSRPPSPSLLHKKLNAMNGAATGPGPQEPQLPPETTLTRNHQPSSCRYLIMLRLEAQSSCLSFLIYGLTNKALFVGYERLHSPQSLGPKCPVHAQ
jgi:hypothetical protein